MAQGSYGAEITYLICRLDQSIDYKKNIIFDVSKWLYLPDNLPGNTNLWKSPCKSVVYGVTFIRSSLIMGGGSFP